MIKFSRRLSCGEKATIKCLWECTSVPLSPSPPFLAPSVDIKCMATCIPKKYRNCLSEVAKAIAS